VVRHAGEGEDLPAVLVTDEDDGGGHRERDERQHQQPAAAARHYDSELPCSLCPRRETNESKSIEFHGRLLDRSS
jgi:hypothetical protein